jgi:hypothetical protein
MDRPGQNQRQDPCDSPDAAQTNPFITMPHPCHIRTTTGKHQVSLSPRQRNGNMILFLQGQLVGRHAGLQGGNAPPRRKAQPFPTNPPGRADRVMEQETPWNQQQSPETDPSASATKVDAPFVDNPLGAKQA